MTVKPVYHFKVPEVEKIKIEKKVRREIVTTRKSTMMRVVEFDCDKLGIEEDLGDNVFSIETDKAREAEWMEKLIQAKKAEKSKSLNTKDRLP